MGVTRVVNQERQYYFDYRITGLGSYLGQLVLEQDEAIRDKMAQEILATLYPTTSAQVLVRVKDPVPELWPDHTHQEVVATEGEVEE